MSILKENKIYIIILLVNLMFTFRIIAESYLMIDFKFQPLIVIISISIIAYFIFDYIFKKFLAKILFIVTIITLGLAFIFYFGLANDIYMLISNNIVAINGAVQSTSVTYYEQYKLFFIWCIPLLVFLFLIFADRGITNLVLIYSMVVMVLFWYLGFPKIVKMNLSIFIFIVIVSFGANNCVGSLKKLKKSNSNIVINSGKICLFFLIPAFVIAIVAAKLPQEYKGNNIGVINGNLISAFGTVNNNNNLVKKTYGLEDSGYSSSFKKLGGAININDNLVLSVEADKPEYLRGSIMDNYNGFAWSKSKEDYSLKVKEGHSVLNSNNLLSQFLYNEKKITVYPEESRNSSIFTPIYAFNVQLDKGNVYYDDVPTFVADLSKVKTYNINYYDFLEVQAFENCSNLDWLKASASIGHVNSTEFKQKYENYLQVPNTITQRTIDLLNSISSYEDSRYNTISKIKEYLDKNYPYTTNVSEVPGNQDFIDNFLFTERKGYCVYFATAATILCRMEGIPARYVEGFKMPELKDSDGLYKVTNKEAHAWCEVLVDPVKNLWTTLEVTPSTVSANSLPIVPKVVVPVSKTSTNPSGKVKNLSEIKDKTGNGISIGSLRVSRINIVMYSFLAIIILIVAKILTSVAYTRKILKGRSVIPYYRYCLKRLKQIGIVKPENLGDLEFAEALEDKKLKVMFRNIVIIAYDEFYGKKYLSNVNRNILNKELEIYIKRYENRSKYFIKKYLFF